MSAIPASDVASFMLECLSSDGLLYQNVVVYEIQSRFGDEFVYTNDNGNLAIDAKVLAAFRELTDGDVVWDKRGRFWRFREDYDGSASRLAN